MQSQKPQQIKQCPNFELYNFMQDLRHLIIIDTRDITNENQTFIRGSYLLKKRSGIKEFIEFVNESVRKGEQFEKKYNSKKIRRAVFYDQLGQLKPENLGELEKYANILKQQDPEFRVYLLKEGYEQFQKKYDFLCLSQEDFQKYGQMQQFQQNENDQKMQNDKQQQEKTENDQIREKLLTDVQRKVLFANAQFPIEIQDSKLYLGNIYHANSDMMLKSLGIKTIIDFTHGHQETFKKRMEENLVKNYKYQYIPIEKNKMAGVEFDFNEINEFIDEQLENNNGPVLMFCKDGNSISSNFAISYLMYEKGLPFQIASLKVFQYKGGVIDTCKNIYTQLMTYQPKK
ncbi:Rhodanese-like domain [Pseudocohnilembus persalinus]|uniref:protein-tyrosine-phosphatase n=1 Tax=Pseudocohnilembus persalinus TaxID=266149 RepID=A0A0V0R904_PSEPJ|nr:Rhodanese-like domain [Pseudocohnilembus persalinus]|eukprot:KRX10958.1 Rhodanese-like domain [Pseudocohnilembus persalinus]